MLPFKLVHHPGYDLNFGDHVFPTQKYLMIRQRLLQEHFAAPDDFVMPTPAPDEDVLAVHEQSWVERLRSGTLSYYDILKLEVPYSRQMVRAFWLAAGGTTLAARLALRDGIGFNLGGGFHHAFPGHGEGFCAINDIAVAIRRLRKDGLIRRAMVIDCDVHHGNGTAAIFSGDTGVFTISIHQLNNYPAEKPPSNIDIDLADETGDDEYLERLHHACVPAVTGFKPELVVYVAGADPYYQDQLGGLSLTLEGLRARDHMVISCALMQGAAVAVALAGGYAVDVNDTVTIHANTVKAAREVLDRAGWKKSE
ncbi:MAG TPA: histone deacetylase [Bryobacteraceae bacterium]|nr:histone deacetylase [Bryobacteraceae bacterium]